MSPVSLYTYIASKSERSGEIYSAVSIDHRDIVITSYRCGIYTIRNSTAYNEVYLKRLNYTKSEYALKDCELG